MVMVDRMIDCNSRSTVTESTVRADNIFVEEGVLTEAGLMENVAQSCAARIGYLNAYSQNSTVKLGIIGAVRNFEFEALPPVGSVLHTSVTVRSEVFGITLVDAVVECDERTIATCEMKISLTDIDSKA